MDRFDFGDSGRTEEPPEDTHTFLAFTRSEPLPTNVKTIYLMDGINDKSEDDWTGNPHKVLAQRSDTTCQEIVWVFDVALICCGPLFFHTYWFPPRLPEDTRIPLRPPLAHVVWERSQTEL